MGRVQDLVDNVLSQGEFDATPAQALQALTRRHRKMVVRARCYRKTVSIGPTVANVRDYALPTDLTEIFEVTVAGITYSSGKHLDVSTQVQGRLWLSGPGGVTSAEEDAAGLGTLALIPTPTTSGDPILARGAFAPPPLLTADDTTLKIPEEYDEALEDGAIATLMGRGPGDFRSDLGAGFGTAYANGCEELRVQTSRRYRGPGPRTIRVAGFNA